jgi:hypothetical protein
MQRGRYIPDLKLITGRDKADIHVQVGRRQAGLQKGLSQAYSHICLSVRVSERLHDP